MFGRAVRLGLFALLSLLLISPLVLAEDSVTAFTLPEVNVREKAALESGANI